MIRTNPIIIFVIKFLVKLFSKKLACGARTLASPRSTRPTRNEVILHEKEFPQRIYIFQIFVADWRGIDNAVANACAVLFLYYRR